METCVPVVEGARTLRIDRSDILHVILHKGYDTASVRIVIVFIERAGLLWRSGSLVVAFNPSKRKWLLKYFHSEPSS